MTYAEKLKDPRWQKRRLEVMNRDGFKCRYCGDDKKTLNVHHLKYSKGGPWETPPEFLTTACESCHEFIEDLKKNMSEAMADKDFVISLGRLVNLYHDSSIEAARNVLGVMSFIPGFSQMLDNLVTTIRSQVNEARNYGYDMAKKEASEK